MILWDLKYKEHFDNIKELNTFKINELREDLLVELHLLISE